MKKLKSTLPNLRMSNGIISKGKRKACLSKLYLHKFIARWITKPMEVSRVSGAPGVSRGEAERFLPGGSMCKAAHGHDPASDHDTPVLNAPKALHGAPISMGRGEIPVGWCRQPSIWQLRKERVHKLTEIFFFM